MDFVKLWYPKEILDLEENGIQPSAHLVCLRDSVDLEVMQASIVQRKVNWVDCTITIDSYSRKKHPDLFDALSSLNNFMDEMKAKSGYTVIEQAFVIGGILCMPDLQLLRKKDLKQLWSGLSINFSTTKASTYMEIFQYCSAYPKLMNSSLSVEEFKFRLHGAIREICCLPTRHEDYHIFNTAHN